MSIIALMTDFGTRDHYVAAMKGMILQINPQADIVDVTHEIGSQDLFHGAFVLRQTVPYFPPQSVFVAVVDPTVGTDRRILAARYNDRIVLAPDNGLLTLLHRDADLQEMRLVENHRLFANSPSKTFHGRDILAPIAAHISRGVTLSQLGPVADHMEVLDLAGPRTNQDGTLDGEIMLTDRFGNLITNISAVDLAPAHSQRRVLEVSVGTHRIGPIRTTYADVPRGEPVALIGSTQMLEIAINHGNATERLEASRGTPVTLR